MKPLKPSYREKRRWIVVEFLHGRPEKPREWTIKKLRRMLGSWGYAMSVRSVEEKGGRILIEVAKDWADIVRGALVLGKENFIPVTYISGSVKALKRKGFITEWR